MQYNPATRKPDATPYKGVEHRVPALNEPRVMIEVNVAGDGVVIAGQHMPQTKRIADDGAPVYDPNGRDRFIIYAREVPAVQARVATAEHLEAWKRAEASAEEQFRQWVVETNRDLLKNPDALARERARYGGKPEHTNPAKEFCRSTKKTGLPPLRFFKVIEDVPPPETPETLANRSIDGMAAAFERAIQAVAGKGKSKASEPTG